MPSAQVVNLNPPARTETTPLEKTLSGFAKRNRENQLEADESDALKEIYAQYQSDGKNIENAIFNLRTKPGISPTTRVETARQLLEFQKYNSELQKKAKDEAEKAAKNKNIVRDLEIRRGLPEGSLAAYEQDPNLANQVSKPEKGSVGNEPLSEDQLRRIEQVESRPDFKDASLPVKTQMLRRAKVSDRNIKGVVEPYAEQEKLENERGKVITKKQAENDVAFVEEQAAKYQQLLAREQTIKAADVLNEEGVTGNNWDAAMQRAGLLQYTSEGFREFASYAKEMVKNANIKSIIGSQISAMEFGFFRDATISERFSKEANRQILKKEELAVRYDKLYAEITNKLLELNDGIIPERFQEKVNKEFAKQSEKLSEELKDVMIDYDTIQNVPKGKVLMFDKKRNPLHVPENEVEMYKKLGASLS